jgi:type IV pilus biogenesis protein CpaD/CtpE
MINRSVLSVAAVAALLPLAACGSSSKSSSSSSADKQLTAAQYRQQLHAISQDESRAQATVQKAFHARTVSQVTTALRGFAADQQSVSAKLVKLDPPSDAKAANTALARAFADNARAVRGVLGQLGSAKTPKQALAVIGGAKDAQKSGQEIDGALKKLVKLGYAKGS